MAGLTKIINDAHATDAVTTPYKRLLEELSKAGKDSSNLEDVLTYIRSMKEQDMNVASAMTALCSLFVSTVSGLNGDIFRIPAQVISGIGFLGAGIILVRNNNTVAGLTTAAGMWVTATIGVAFGYGFYGGGVLTTIICVVNAALLTKFEHRHLQAIRFYVEVDDLERIQDVLDQIENELQKDVYIETIPAKSGIAGRVGFEVTTVNNNNQQEIKSALTRIEGIDFVVPG